MASIISRVLLLAASLLLFAHLHWTQRFETATVTTSSACSDQLDAHKEQHGTLCLYTGITLDTDTLTERYVLRDSKGTELSVSSQEVTGFSYERGARPFTWRTAVVSTAMFLCLMFAVAPWKLFLRLKFEPT